MARERVTIDTDKGKVIVTVKRDSGNKRHIVITTPAHMNWTEIWNVLRKLPKHLEKERKQKKTKPLQKKHHREKIVV